MDLKTADGVYFQVQRYSNYRSVGSVITYELERLNIGGAMNLNSGVFTAPTSGRYQFTFSANSDTLLQRISVLLRVNGASNTMSFAPSRNLNLPISATLNLKRGDKVDMFLNQGGIAGGDSNVIQFSGILLEEDLSI